MPETPFATAQDVADRWRVLTSDEMSVAQYLVDDASDMIRSRWPDVDARITSGALTATSLLRIVVGMVKRAMMNSATEGLESRAQAAGPFSISDKFANPNGNLYLSADDIRLLGGSKSRRAFAVDISPNIPPCWTERY